MGKFLCMCTMAMMVALTFAVFGKPGAPNTARIASIGLVADARGFDPGPIAIDDSQDLVMAAGDGRQAPRQRQMASRDDCAQWNCLPATMDITSILNTPRPRTDG